jgi:hypothetical protein
VVVAVVVEMMVSDMVQQLLADLVDQVLLFWRMFTRDFYIL